MATGQQKQKTTHDPADQPMTGGTKLDEDVKTPSTTQPGDGPADTTDPTERASSVTPQPGPEALKAGTVNAVQPVPDRSTSSTSSTAKARVETYTATRPDGTEVKVKHDLNTGKTEVQSGS